jgi:hypothetical protein
LPLRTSHSLSPGGGRGLRSIAGDGRRSRSIGRAGKGASGGAGGKGGILGDPYGFCESRFKEQKNRRNLLRMLRDKEDKTEIVHAQSNIEQNIGIDEEHKILQCAVYRIRSLLCSVLQLLFKFDEEVLTSKSKQ